MIVVRRWPWSRKFFGYEVEKYIPDDTDTCKERSSQPDEHGIWVFIVAWSQKVTADHEVEENDAANHAPHRHREESHDEEVVRVNKSLLVFGVLFPPHEVPEV